MGLLDLCPACVNLLNVLNSCQRLVVSQLMACSAQGCPLALLAQVSYKHLERQDWGQHWKGSLSRGWQKVELAWRASSSESPPVAGGASAGGRSRTSLPLPLVVSLRLPGSAATSTFRLPSIGTRQRAQTGHET